MSNTFDTTLAGVLARLRAAPAIRVAPSKAPASVQRSHLIPTAGDAVHVLDGSDAPSSKRCEREGAFTIRLVVRSDLGPAAVGALKVEVMRRLNPEVAPYPDGVVLSPGKITPDTEIADTDATRVDMAFTFCYAAREWTLGE